MKIAAVILAAGRGRRMDAGINKVHLSLGGRPLLWHTLRAFSAVSGIDELVVVAHRGEEERIRALAPEGESSFRIVPGGAHRRDSSLAGVRAVHADVVLIHDGARPFPSSALIKRVMQGAIDHGACVPALAVNDTLRAVDSEGWLTERTIPRDGLVRMQTPQGFSTDLIRTCLEESDPRITDDAAAVLRRGTRVWTVPGEATNLKVTTADDLELAEAICSICS